MWSSASRKRRGSRATSPIGWSTNYDRRRSGGQVDRRSGSALGNGSTDRPTARPPARESFRDRRLSDHRPPPLRWRRRLVHGALETHEPARRDPPPPPP